MIQFMCNACHKAYQVTEEHAGRTARCACGARLQVPSPQLLAVGAAPPSFEGAAFQTPCPGCRTPLEPGDVLCVRCGYNRVTGVQIRTSTDDPAEVAETPVASRPVDVARPFDPWSLLRPAMILGFLAVFGGLASWAAYRALSSPYGIDDDAPLGRFEAIDERLVEIDFARKEFQETPHPETGQPIRVYLFEGRRSPDAFPGFHERIAIVVDGAGRVRGIGGQLAPNPEGMTPGAFSKGNMFFRGYWEDLSGDKPKFRSNHGGAVGSPEMAMMAPPAVQVAKLRVAGLRGQWTRTDGPNTVVVYDENDDVSCALRR